MFFRGIGKCEIDLAMVAVGKRGLWTLHVKTAFVV